MVSVGNEAGVMGPVGRRSRVGLLTALLAASILFLGSGAAWAGRYVAKPGLAPSGQKMSAKAYFAAGGTLPALSMTVSSGQISTICVSCALPFDLSQLPLTVESAPLIQIAPQGIVEVRDGYVFVQAPGVPQEISVVLQYSVVVGTAVQTGSLAVTILPNPENLGPLRAYLVDGTNEDGVLDGLALARNASNLTKLKLEGANLTELSRVSPRHGSLSRRADGDYSYSPEMDFYGTDSFTISFLATYSEYQQTLEFHYAIQVDPVNDAPVAMDASATGPAGSVIEIDLASYTRDADVGDVLTLDLAPSEDPDVGKASWQGTKLRYAASADALSSKAIGFIVKDAAGLTARANVTFTIGAGEQAVVMPAAAGVALERVSGSEAQSLKLGSESTLSLRVLNDKGVAAVGWSVAWDAPPDKEDGGFHLSTRDTLTNEIGVATAKAIVGRIPGTYLVKAIITEPSATDSNVAGRTHELTYTIVTGLASALLPGTSEYSIGQVVDSICPKLNQLQAPTPDQEALRDRCNELIGSSNEAQVANALRAMAPEEVANEGRMGNNVTMQQLGNVSARLNALRRGASGVALSGLAFRLDGKILPGEALASLVPDALRGGGASADGGISRWSAFVSGVIGGGEQSKTDQEEGFEFKTAGLTGGVDYRWSNEFVFGVAGGYANTGLDLGGAGGGLDAQGLNFALYGTYYRNEKYYFDGVFNLSRNGYDMDRVVDYTIGSAHYQKVAKGDPDSNVYALSLGGGYEVASVNGYTFEANGRFQYLDSTISSYEETGAGAYNLSIEKQDMSLITVSAGGLFTKAFSFKWGVLVPQLRLTWDHEFAGDAATIKGSFVNGPGGGFNPTFSFKTDEVDRDYFRLGAGTTLVRPGGATAFLQYETTRGKAGYSDYNVAFGGRWEF